MNVTLSNVTSGAADVAADGRAVGSVCRIERNYQPRPGQMATRTGWGVVTLQREAHANPTAGGPIFPTRREAVRALAAGDVRY